MAPTSRLVGANEPSNFKFNIFQDPVIISATGEHNHGPNSDFTKRDTKRKLKELSVNVGTATREIVQDAAMGKSREEFVALPKERSMKRLVQRARKDENVPKNPKEKTDFVIENEYAVYCGEPFLRHDSGVDDPDRILIFMTDQGKKDLESYSHWASDGTFKIRPVIFAQVYMVHVHVNEFQTVPRYAPRIYSTNQSSDLCYEPLNLFLCGTNQSSGLCHKSFSFICFFLFFRAFILLPNKAKVTYEKMWTALKSLGNFNPDSIRIDFEIGCAKAIGNVFGEDCEIWFCLFHLSQNNVKKICEQHKVRYQDPKESDFATRCRMVTALAFVPPKDVIEAFEELVAFDKNHEEKPDLLPKYYVTYFEKTYIGVTVRRNTRRTPT